MDVSWRERIRHISWQWHAVVIATGVCSTLVHNFPYQTSSTEKVFQIIAAVLLLLGLLLFVFLFVCKVIKLGLYPEDWKSMLTDPDKSLFLGFFANGAAALVNAGLAVNQAWGTGSNAFLYTLWGLWWSNSVLACAIASGLMYVMLGQNYNEISNIGPVWLIPSISLITASASGGLFAGALREHSSTYPLVTLSFSLPMLIVGLTFSTMVTTMFLLRLYLHGPLHSSSVLSTFSTLMPLAQGGYSLLLNGQNLVDLSSAKLLDEFTGKMLFSICFSDAFILWTLCLAWMVVSYCSLIHRTPSLVRFDISHWCFIVPNGVYSLCSVQMATVLDSPFYRVWGTVWTCITLLLWLGAFIRSIPAFVNGSLFVPTTTSGDAIVDQKVQPSSKADPDALRSACASRVDVVSIAETLVQRAEDRTISRFATLQSVHNVV